jgi:predicted dienelactone hydrolase
MKRTLRILAILFGIGSACALALVLGLGVYVDAWHNAALQLPDPPGPYLVGRVTYDWVDSARDEAFAGHPSEKRELMVLAWCPADGAGGATAPYMPEPWQRQAERESGIGGLLAHRLSRIQTHSYDRAAPADIPGPLPLVILEPGFGRSSADYNTIAEHLASQGYLVLSSSPTYMTDLVVFDDGRVVRASPQAALPEGVDPLSPEFMAQASALLEVWEGDVAYLIDQAESLNADPSSAFYGRIDTANVGVIGHSFGGAAAYQLCNTDPRCKVAIDLDGTLFGESTTVSAVPFMLISADPSRARGDAKRVDDYTRRIFAAQVQPAYHVTVEGAAHFNFSDLALRASIVYRLLGAVGPIDGARGLAIADQYIDEMLGKYLKGQPSPDLEGKQQW